MLLFAAAAYIAFTQRKRITEFIRPAVASDDRILAGSLPRNSGVFSPPPAGMTEEQKEMKKEAETIVKVYSTPRNEKIIESTIDSKIRLMPALI